MDRERNNDNNGRSSGTSSNGVRRRAEDDNPNNITPVSKKPRTIPECERCDEDIEFSDDESNDDVNDYLKRHRNYQFSLPLSKYESANEYFTTLWRNNTKYILYQKEGKYISHIFALYITAVFIVSDNGYRHIQAYVEFRNAVAYNKAKDLLGVSYVKAVKQDDKRAVMAYCCKLQTRMANTEPISYGMPSIDIFNDIAKTAKLKTTRNTRENAWNSALHAKSKSHAIEIIKNNFPETYLCKKKVIHENLESEFGHKAEQYFNTFSIPFFNVWNQKAHIFIGPTNIGKTSFALAHFVKPVHIKGIQSFGRISSDPEICDGIVIDDIPIGKLPSNELLGILDVVYENVINIKYSVGFIPAFLPRIICLNKLSQLYPKTANLEIQNAITRRSDIHIFDKNLYNKYIDVNSLQVPQKSKYRPRDGILPSTSIVLQDIPKKNVTCGTECNDTVL